MHRANTNWLDEVTIAAQANEIGTLGAEEMMIGYLAGEARDGDLVVCGGIGWRVRCASLLTDGPVELYVSSIVREQEISFYGFASRVERDLFEQLLSAPRVGPAVSLALIRDVGAARLVEAIVARDAKPLERAKGVGKKAAETIVATVKLPENMAALAETDDGSGRDLRDAIEALGYEPEATARAVRTAMEAHPDADETTLIVDVMELLRKEEGRD